jgi:transposase
MMHQEAWMRLRALKPLADRGMSWAEIGREAGCDWRTPRKYLTQAPTPPPIYRPRKPQAKLIDAFAEVIDVMLYADPFLKAAVIHERIAAAPYGVHRQLSANEDLCPSSSSGDPARTRTR